ncbi:MAG: response regulator transcription factor [Armatimonadota bacterium]
MAHTILIIEDQRDIAELVALILGGEGYGVLIAGCGEEGLRQLVEQAVDLVLLDLMLPDIDGWDICRHMRATESLADIPILLFTVRRTQLDGDWPGRAMVNGIINKPFEREALLAMVQQTLEA